MINTAQEHLARVYELLVKTYGVPTWEPDHDPLGGLIGTILSQHTSDINSGRAYRQLVKEFPSWEQVRDGSTTQVAQAIRSGGLANIKAVRIQEALHTLTDWQKAQGNTQSLADFLYRELSGLTPEEARTYLLKIPGVGPKTAACVLLFNLGLDILPIDTHIHRVCRRLGLIGPKVSADKAHVLVEEMSPPGWRHTLHVDLIQHGRKICHAQRPQCPQCPLFAECAYVGSIDPHATVLENENTRTQTGKNSIQ